MHRVVNEFSFFNKSFWVFDLDGTLTVPCHDFIKIRKALDIPLESDILGHINLLPRKEAQDKQVALDQIEEDMARQATPALGAEVLIKTLTAHNIEIGILTRNTKKVALLTLEKIGLMPFFKSAVILGRDEAEPKPSPDGVHKLLSYWQAPKFESLLVGDYLYDLQTAKAAGISAIHVDNKKQFLWPEFTDLTLASLEELQKLFLLDKTGRA